MQIGICHTDLILVQFLIVPVSTNIVMVWHKAHASWRGTYVNPCKSIRTVLVLLCCELKALLWLFIKVK